MRTPIRFKAETEYEKARGKKANTNLPIMATVGDHLTGAAAVAGRPGWYHIRLGGETVANPNPTVASRLTQCKAEGVGLVLNDLIFVVKAKDRNLTYYKFHSFIQSTGGLPHPLLFARGLIIPDNVAQGFYVIDDDSVGAGTPEYLRIDTRDGPAQVVTWNFGGADVDFTIEASGVADAFQVRGSDGRITLGALGAGLLESDAAGVIASDYTINSTVTMAAGQDIDPANVSGQDLGDATHRWDLYTQEVYFGGATGANLISLLDNLADALHVVSADAIEYLRFITTNGSEQTLFDPAGVGVNLGTGVAAALYPFHVGAPAGGTDVNIDVACLGLLETGHFNSLLGEDYVFFNTTNASYGYRFDVNDGTIVWFDNGGNVGIGVAPTAGQHFVVEDLTVVPTGNYYGIYADHVVTDATGATEADDIYGAYIQATMNDAGETIGFLYGLYVNALLQAGTIGDGEENLQGMRVFATMTGGTAANSVHGIQFTVDIDDGDIAGHVYGVYSRVDIESMTGAIGGDVYGVYVWVDADEDPVGSVYMLYLEERAPNVDYGIYQNGTAINYFGGSTGVGVAPTVAHHFRVEDATLDVTATWYGIYNRHIKTAGDTDENDHLYNIDSYFEMNHADTIGYIYGLRTQTVLTLGTVGTALANRAIYGANLFARVGGGTLNGNLYGMEMEADVTGTGTITGDVYAFNVFLDLNSGTVNGDAYGCRIRADDDLGIDGTVYMLYLSQATGVNYAIYHTGGAPSVLGGHLYPANVKTQDLGLATNEWDDIFYVTVNVGTSRLVRATRMCPVCGTEMSRGTGTTIYRGEEADYAVCFCLNCGNAAVEVLNHLPPEKEIEKRPPPVIVLENLRVKSAGRNRSVAIDFRYGEDMLDELGEVTTQAIRNSTRLGEYEVDDFLAMDSNDRLSFLLALGEREWYSREETRLMREEAESLKVATKSKVNIWLGKDLLKETMSPN